MLVANLFVLYVFLQTAVGDPNHFNGYLILAYVVMAAIALLYIFSLVIRQRNLQQDIELMKQILQEDEETRD